MSIDFGMDYGTWHWYYRGQITVKLHVILENLQLPGYTDPEIVSDIGNLNLRPRLCSQFRFKV